MQVLAVKMTIEKFQKCSGKVVEIIIKVHLQLKYSGSHPASIDCQKDSGTTVGNGTQVKPVLSTAIIFAV